MNGLEVFIAAVTTLSLLNAYDFTAKVVSPENGTESGSRRR